MDGWVDEVGNKLLKFKLIRIDWNCGWFVLHQSHKVTHFAPICARWNVGSNASGLPDEEREEEMWKICHYFQARSICLHAIRNRDQIICISQRNTWRRLISHSFVNCFSFSSLLLLCGSVCQLFLCFRFAFELNLSNYSVENLIACKISMHPFFFFQSGSLRERIGGWDIANMWVNSSMLAYMFNVHEYTWNLIKFPHVEDGCQVSEASVRNIHDHWIENKASLRT